MTDRLRFFLKRLGQRLWLRPLVACVFSLGAVFFAKAAEGIDAPVVTSESVEALLSILATGMLPVATFAVASMVSAYASASTNATPRSFPLVVSDDVSQNALSSFVGAFIYGIVAQVALMNEYYGPDALFVLFCLTIGVLVAVVLMFVHWVDRIARLGRLGATVDKVENATAEALRIRLQQPFLRGVAPRSRANAGRPVFGDSVGFVQRVDIERLQSFAAEHSLRIVVNAVPGDFSTPSVPLAHLVAEADAAEIDPAEVIRAFVVQQDRTFAADPGFGLVVLSEIASRALSPAINDPGTAIDVLGTYVRIFALWANTEAEDAPSVCDRVEVPELDPADLLTDAFRAIARDGAGMVEVALTLQLALGSIANMGDGILREPAQAQSILALARAERALDLQDDLDVVRAAHLAAASVAT